MIFNTKIKQLIILIILLALFIFISAVSYTKAVCSDIQDSVFRLHVIANSDSTDDQNLKYIVRDSIISYINEISKNATSKEEVMQIVKNNIENIKEIALKTIQENGYSYSVNVSVGNYVFPSKKYGDITLPPRIL